MRLFIIGLICMLSACCTTQTPICPEQQIITQQTEQDKQKVKEKAAWEYAENEEVVKSIEQSDPQKWVIGFSKEVILGETHDLFITFRFNKVYFRMSIFLDGALYLDGEKREMCEAHKARLAVFFEKVIKR